MSRIRLGIVLGATASLLAVLAVACGDDSSAVSTTDVEDAAGSAVDSTSSSTVEASSSNDAHANEDADGAAILEDASDAAPGDAHAAESGASDADAGSSDASDAADAKDAADAADAADASDACVPATCSKFMGALCGPLLNGCGGIVNCTCSATDVCVNSLCCTPTKCTNIFQPDGGRACGVHTDNCGSTIDCGPCADAGP